MSAVGLASSATCHPSSVHGPEQQKLLWASDFGVEIQMSKKTSARACFAIETRTATICSAQFAPIESNRTVSATQRRGTPK